MGFSDLTLSERVLAVGWMIAPGLLTIFGGVFVATSYGTVRVIGIVLLLVGLIAAAVPMSPALRRRVERRRKASAPDS